MNRRPACALALVFFLLGGGWALAADDSTADEAAEPAVKPEIHIRSKDTQDSDADSSGPAFPDLSLIDAPTAATLDQAGYYAQSRFYSGGGLLQNASFGVLPGLNIGASLSVDNLIGRSNLVYVRSPEAQIKYRFYDGQRYIPAFAIGYDGQGYDYNQISKTYNEQRRGLYLVASQELFFPGLEIHPSVNFSNFNSHSFYGAVPLSYAIKDRAALMFEWDNIGSPIDQSRLNAGLRVYITSGFHVDFAVRGIGQGGNFADGTPKGPERIVQLAYTGSF